MVTKIKNNKLLKILFYLIIFISAILIIKITYAYLEAVHINDIKDVSIIGSSVDKLEFIEGDKLNIEVSSNNLVDDELKDNIASTTKPKVTLLANNVKNEATYSYYIYLEVNNTGFKYTTDDHKPEIILSITKPDKQPLTKLGDLAYKTENGVTGFDITEFNGTLNIAEGFPISANSTKITEQEWIIIITYVNLSSNQVANNGQAITTNLYITKNELKNFSDYIKQLHDTNASVGDGAIIYHDGTILGTDKTVLDANDYSYRFTGNNPNNYVCFGNGSEDYNAGKSTNCPDKNLYRIIGIFKNANDQYEVKLIKSEYLTEQELRGITTEEQSISLSSYSEDSSTYNPRVKKVEENNGFRWNINEYTSWPIDISNKYNLWEYEGQKATLNNDLNDYYLNNSLKDYQDLLTDNVWHVLGGNEADFKENIPHNVFDKEILQTTNPGYSVSQTTTTEKIGLMYVSDYAYAASNVNELWNTYLYSETNETGYNSANNRQNNWLYNGIYEWTITRNSTSSDSAFVINSNGSITGNFVNTDYACGVRPVFYLNSMVKVIDDGNNDGSANHPYKVM